MPLFDLELDNGDVMTVEHPQAPTPEEAQAVISNALTPSPTASKNRGGIGRPTTREEAREIASERLVGRARQAGQQDIVTGREIGRPDVVFATPTGIIPQISAFSREFARNVPGSFSEPVLSLAESLASIAGLGDQARMFGRENLARQMPLTAEAGQLASLIAGGKMAGGKLLETPTTRTLLKQGATLGGGIGGTMQLSESLAEGASPGETLLRTGLGTLAGSALGVGTTAIPAAALKLQTLLPKLRQTTDDLLTFTTGGTSAPSAFKERMTSGGFADVLPDIARMKSGRGVAGTEEAVKKLNDEAAGIFSPIVKGADPASSFFDPIALKSQLDEVMKLRIPVEATRTKLVNRMMSKYGDSVNPDNLTSYTRDLGESLTNFYKSTDKAKYGDSIHALEAMRNVFGQNIRNILSEKGIPPEIWSKYGKINELADQISKNYGDELIAHRARTGEGLLGRQGVEPTDLLQKIPLVSSALRIAGNLKSRATGGTPALLNRRVDQLFANVKIGKAPLTKAEKDILLEGAKERIESNRQAGIKASEEATPQEIQDYLNASRNEQAQSKVTREARSGIEEQFPSAESLVRAQQEAETFGATPQDINQYFNEIAAGNRTASEADLARAISLEVEKALSPGALSQALQKSVSNATLFPARPTGGRPTVLASVEDLYKGMTTQELNQEMVKLANAGRLREAQAISDYLKSRLGL